MSTANTSRFVYLASASPRRRELLVQVGLRSEVLQVSVPERPRAGEAAAALTARLAADKARAGLAARRQGDVPVIAADTAVSVDGEILEKPLGEADGRRMLQLLSGRSHEVYTAVVVTDGSRAASDMSRSVVRFRPVSAAEMDAYWRTGEPRDKAGGYAIQGIAAVFVESIEGSYSGVMGLPLFETARLLEGFGYRALDY
jgi:septum formation protein